MLGFDTAMFLRLRAAVTSDTPILPHIQKATTTALKALRDEATALFRESDTPQSRASFRELFCRTWRQLATLDEFANPFSLPPAYETNDLGSHVSWAANSLYALERNRRPIGDNAVFAGSKGTGKTTMLQVTGAAAAVLLSSTVPIFWTYESEALRTPTIGQLLEAATLLRTKPAEGFSMQS
jgi:hypothetical protein